MEHHLQRVYRALLALSCLSMVACLVAISLNMLTRVIDGWSIAGLDGYAGYAIASALFLALPAAFQGGDHIRVTILLDRTTGKAHRALHIWSLGLASVLSVYVAWFSCRMVWQSHVFHDIAQTGDASPLWIPQLSMAVGTVGLAVSVLHALVRCCLGAKDLGADAIRASQVE